MVVPGGAFVGGFLRAGPFAAGIEHVLDLVDRLLDGLAGKPVQRFERRQLHRSDPGAPPGELEREEPRRRADVENAQAAHVLGEREALQAAAKIVEPGRYQPVSQIDGVVPVVARGFIEAKRPQTFVETACLVGMLGRDAPLLFRLKLLDHDELPSVQRQARPTARAALHAIRPGATAVPPAEVFASRNTRHESRLFHEIRPECNPPWSDGRTARLGFGVTNHETRVTAFFQKLASPAGFEPALPP